MVFTALVLFSFQTKAQGLFQTFDTIIKIQKTNYNKKLQTLVNRNFELSDIKDVNQVKLDPDFIASFIFNSPSRYISLGIKDKCSLYDLLTTDLLQGNSGPLDTVIIQYKDQKGKNKTHTLPLSSFMTFIAYKQCPKVKKLKTYFLPKNLRQTLKTYSLKTPTSYTQCFDVHKSFVNDIKTPHLCSLIENIRNVKQKRTRLRNMSRANFRKYTNLKVQIDQIESSKKIIKPNALNYLTDLCLNINKPKLFCNSFFEQNTWTKVSKSKDKRSILRHYCSDLYPKKKSLSKQNIKECVKKLTKENKLCHTLGTQKGALFPKPNCKLISKALAFSNLFSDYDDCPALAGNEVTTSLSRLFIHLDQKIPLKPTHCSLYSTQPYAQFSVDNNDAATWQVNLCYEDKIKREKVCLPTILGNIADSKINISQNIQKIAARLKGYKSPKGCQVIKQSRYQPALLEYQNGCFIIFNENHCLGTDCQFKVIIDQQPFTNFSFESDLSFDLFPRRFIDENKSIIKVLETIKRKRFKIIKSVSSLTREFKKDPKTVVLGISCAEGILPTFYKTKHINQCTPLPYLVDGFIEKNGIYSLIIRTSLDHIHAPRIIPWSYVFDSLVQYQKYHPTGLWGLNAIN